MFGTKAEAAAHFSHLRERLPKASLEKKNLVWQGLAWIDLMPKDWLTAATHEYRKRIAFCFTPDFAGRDVLPGEVQTATQLLDQVMNDLQPPPTPEVVTVHSPTAEQPWLGDGI